MDMIEELITKLDQQGMTMAMGLEAQGHIPTIERIISETSGEVKWKGKMSFVDTTYNKYVWDKIGREIGWDPFTAALDYFEYISKNKTKPTEV